MLIADEDTVSATMLRSACEQIPGINVAGTMVSSQMLLARLLRRDIDLVLLDLAGGMGRNDLIDQIKIFYPLLTIVIVFSPGTSSPKMLVKALEDGVHDCIEKPADIHSDRFREFRIRLGTVAGIIHHRRRFSQERSEGYKSRFFIPVARRPDAVERNIPQVFATIDVIVIAASTGGPEILSHIFGLLPAAIQVPILVVQHMPAYMTSFFANSLNMKSELNIIHANDGNEIVPSTIYIAPGRSHMTVSTKDDLGRRFIRLSDTSFVNNVRPSADVLFESVADSYDGHILAVILTGMGQDGRDGVRKMKKKGCICLTQTAESCAVYGMPRAVDEAGLSDACLDPVSLTQKIAQAASGRVSRSTLSIP